MGTLWPSYLINMADDTARMEKARRQFEAQGLPFSRLDAVNGRALPDAEIARVYDRRANARRGKADLVAPEIGCYLSHYNAWQRIAAAPEAGAFVFEDDLAITGNLRDILDALSADTVGDWDMVKLFSINPAPAIRSSRPLVLGHDLAVPARVPSTTLGYAITRQAAQKLAATALPFFRPVDEDLKYFWEHGLRIGLILPAPLQVGDQQTTSGTIGDARRGNKRKSLSAGLRSLHYRLHYQIAVRWHSKGKTR